MVNSQSSSESMVAHRLGQLAELYERSQASELMSRTLDKLLSYETELCRVQMKQLLADLTEFEKRYNMPSAEFFHRFQSGETDDRMDYIEWASLVQMVDNLKQRLFLLADES